MADKFIPVTTDKDAARAARERILKEESPGSDRDDAPESRDPLGPGDDRREKASENIDLGITRRTD